MKTIHVLAAVVFGSVCAGCTLPAPFFSRSIHLLSYNVENLFDDRDDGTEYDDYDPGSDSWSTSLYHAKLQNISQAIEKSVKGGPDVCLLQEIESQKALDDLNNGYLNTLGYRYTFVAPRGNSATSVSVLSRLPIIGIHVHRVDAGISMRPVLEVELAVGDSSITILNNHWKSKSGGAEETEKYRIESASLIRSRIIGIIEQNPSAFILVSGDLNERVDEYREIDRVYQTALLPDEEGVPAHFSAKSIFVTSAINDAGLDGERLVLYSPWWDSEGLGSYLFHGLWERIDHFMIYDGNGAGNGLDISSFSVAALEFLLREDDTPRRWSSLSATGYSDHLPLLLTIDRS